MAITPDLLNASSVDQTLIDYDRCCGGSFYNPYEGSPSISFAMRRAKIVDGSEDLISETPLPDVREPYVAGKTYQMMNPKTGQPITGATFSADQVYAMLWSMMYAKMTSISAAKAALAAATATYESANSAYQVAFTASQVASRAAAIAQATASISVPPTTPDPAIMAASATAQAQLQVAAAALQNATQARTDAQIALVAIA